MLVNDRCYKEKISGRMYTITASVRKTFTPIPTTKKQLSHFILWLMNKTVFRTKTIHLLVKRVGGDFFYQLKIETNSNIIAVEQW